jgi:hypothetical protein
VSPSRSGGVERRTFLKTATAAAFGLALGAPEADAAVTARPVLYNGIALADPWPPVRRTLPSHLPPPPYLAAPPAVIPIDVGRQLFVDDFLIEETSLVRVFHRAEYHAGNPILTPTEPWERKNHYAEMTHTHPNSAAMVFSDGVFFDPRERLFKMWYMGGYAETTCYAYSHDGISWTKPSLDVVRGTNIVLDLRRDSSTVWLDLHEPDPRLRYKLAVTTDVTTAGHMLRFASADGIHWRRLGTTGRAGDRTTFFYNPFRGVWVFSIRDQIVNGRTRCRRYWETTAFDGRTWGDDEPVLWMGADADDPSRPEYNVPPELYNLDCVAYESIVLGLFTIWHGEDRRREKPNDISVGYSRDGFHWSRPDRTAFVPVSEHAGAWNWANVQSAGGGCLVVGDRLYFYVSGRQGVSGTDDPGVCSTGLATLRRDGFASMESPSSAGVIERIAPTLPPGTLVTRPVSFSGGYLFVNADASRGAVRVEVLDLDGRTIAPFSGDRCQPIRIDGTAVRVRWDGAEDVCALAGRPVRFRFRVAPGGRLYAFWVSPTPNGASHGYVAAGGPGFTGPTDTVGSSV